MIIDEALVKNLIQPRPLKSHKGTFGRALLIGGLYPYGGAIIMAALATVNSGAGLVTVASDPANISALHSHLPEAMAFDLADSALLTQQIQASNVILIGPGLGTSPLAQKTLALVLAQTSPEQILIIDGSALDLLAEKDQIDWPTQKLALTPHQKEWERLSGIAIAQQNQENTQTALAIFPSQTILVAKSHKTRIYDQTGQVGQLAVGGPYQATGGMGDTLAGMITGFVAQFRDDLFESVAAASYLHSAIADSLAQDAYIVLPTSISQEIPRWMKRISEES